LTTSGQEPEFEALGSDTNPIEEAVQDANRKKYLSEAFQDFNVFSDKIL
jgi:hypothetical protein